MALSRPAPESVLNRQRRFPVVDVVSVEKAANAVFAARDAGDHHIFHDQRRAGDAVARFAGPPPARPREPRRSSRSAQPDARPRCREIRGPPAPRRRGSPASQQTLILRGKASLVMPVRPPRGGIQRKHVGRRLSDVHDAVHHNGSGLNTVARRHLVYPGDFQIGHILAIDLIERAITPTPVRSASKSASSAVPHRP